MKDEIFWEARAADSGPIGLEVGEQLRVRRGKCQAWDEKQSLPCSYCLLNLADLAGGALPSQPWPS